MAGNPILGRGKKSKVCNIHVIIIFTNFGQNTAKCYENHALLMMVCRFFVRIWVKTTQISIWNQTVF